MENIVVSVKIFSNAFCLSWKHTEHPQGIWHKIVTFIGLQCRLEALHLWPLLKNLHVTVTVLMIFTNHPPKS